jgi:AcrR family transcriptional regulator
MQGEVEMSAGAAGSLVTVNSRLRRTKAEQTKQTRRLIIATGIFCLANFGYARTTMQLISQRAGISRGPLNYHFSDRTALMSAIAEALPREVTRALVKRLDAVTSPQERFATILDVALEEHRGDHHYSAIELLLAARSDPNLADAILPHFLASEDLIDRWWCDYLAALRWPVTPLLAWRHVLVSCMRGLALDHVLQKDTASHANAVALTREMFLSFVSSPPEQGPGQHRGQPSLPSDESRYETPSGDGWVPARGGVPKDEQTRRTRKLIVEAGIRCLAKFGYAKTTIMMISAEAGISRGPFHYHFEDRNALMAAVAEALPLTVSAEIAARLRLASSIGERLDAIISLTADHHLGDSHFASLELLIATRHDQVLADAVRPHFEASNRIMDDQWASYLRLLAWPRERLIALRHVTIACLRGLAVSKVLRSDLQLHIDAFGMLQDMFIAFVDSTELNQRVGDKWS